MLTVSIQSCKTDPMPVSMGKTITINLKVNESYQYDLGGFGIEEGAGISTQAVHYLVSESSRDVSGNTPNIIYRYKPSNNFVGSDQVILKSERGSNGASANPDITYTTIKFTIAN